MSGVDITPATAADAEILHALVLRLAETTGEARLVRSSPDDFRRFGFEVEPPAFEALIAWGSAERSAPAAVGFILYFSEFSSWRGRPGVYVQDVWVDQARRGEGLGVRLLAAALRRGAGGRAVYARLSVASDNRAARAFYARRGFHEHAHDHLVIDGPAFERLLVEAADEAEETT